MFRSRLHACAYVSVAGECQVHWLQARTKRAKKRGGASEVNQTSAEHEEAQDHGLHVDLSVWQLEWLFKVR